MGVTMIMIEPQQPPPPSLLPKIEEEDVVAASSAAMTSDDVAALTSSPPIFHVLLLPGGNTRKDAETDGDDKKPNVIIDDYLYQRHVYRKKAAARSQVQRSNKIGSNNAAKVKDQTLSDDDGEETPLNLLVSPLEIALVSCCVRLIKNDSYNHNISSAEVQPTQTQRSRLHRPILPSNAADCDDNVPLDTPRNISVRDPKQQDECSDNKSESKWVGTLKRGKEAHFLKLLQMYCPAQGLQFRALALEILQRTVDRENSSCSSDDNLTMKTFLAIGGMKLLARWLVESYTVIQPPPSPTNASNKKKQSVQKQVDSAAVSPSPTGALLLPLLSLLKSIPFDKEIIVASQIHKYIKRYKKLLTSTSKGLDLNSLNDVLHPTTGGVSVGKATSAVDEVMTSWNNATNAAAAVADASNGREEKEKLDPHKDLRDQLQSRFDELAAFHNNRTNPPDWLPKHVLGVVMASPIVAVSSPLSPTASTTPTSNTISNASSNQPIITKNNSNEWGTNRASAAQIARERFLEGFRKRKEADLSSSSTSTSSTGLVISGSNIEKMTNPPAEKMRKIGLDNDGSSSSSKRVWWVDDPIGKNGVTPQPLVEERVFVKEEEYVVDDEEEEDVEVHNEMFGVEEEDCNVAEEGEGVVIIHQADVLSGEYPLDQGDVVMEEVAVKEKEEKEDSDLDDMF